MIRLTRRYRFAASHRLHTDALTEEENWKVYGKCNNPYGHGHDYLLEVVARGPVEDVSGKLLRVPELDSLVERKVLAEFAQANLNDSPAFAAKAPTTENLVSEIEGRLRDAWREVFPGRWPEFAGVRIQETRRNRCSSSEAGR